MRSRAWLCAFALLATVACLMFGCASQPPPTGAQTAHAALIDLRAAVLVVIKDAMRAQEVSALVDQLDEQDHEAREVVATYRQRLRALDANYDATEDNFNKLFADFNSERLTRQGRITVLWTTMANLMSDAEWEAVRKARVAAVKALVTPS